MVYHACRRSRRPQHPPPPPPRRTYRRKKESATLPSYSQIFGDWLCGNGRNRRQISRHYTIRAKGLVMCRFCASRFPETVILTILPKLFWPEQGTQVTFAAGLSTCWRKIKPGVSGWRFHWRSCNGLLYDQLIPDVPAFCQISDVLFRYQSGWAFVGADVLNPPSPRCI